MGGSGLKAHLNILGTSARLYKGIMGKGELWNFWCEVLAKVHFSALMLFFNVHQLDTCNFVAGTDIPYP